MIRESFFFCCFSFLLVFSSFDTFQKQPGLCYLPLGDSYTIGTGASEQESWPWLLAADLSTNGLSCRVCDNPARNGYTTTDLIEKELPLVKKLRPDFVTLLIGVNDWVRGVPKADFSKNLNYILDVLQTQSDHKPKLLLLTIPDFGVTPEGKNYAGGRDISKGLEEFNDIIRREAKKRDLPVVELFELSKAMSTDNSLIAKDGLHPSAKEYSIWEKRILPEALKVLK